MANKTDERKQIVCSFCGKRHGQVRKLISGPEGIFICNECVELCAELIEEEFEEEDTEVESNKKINLLKPMDIKGFLDHSECSVLLLILCSLCCAHKHKIIEIKNKTQKHKINTKDKDLVVRISLCIARVLLWF